MIESISISQRNILTGIIVAALLAACAVALLLVLVNARSSETAEGVSKNGPVTVELLGDDSGLATVSLTEKAAERVGIAEAVVTEAGSVREGSSGKLAIPYSAILYDAKGNSFVYTVTGLLTYVRAPITVDYIEGDQAILSDGPSVGTEVVALGVAELYGAETGIK